MPKRVMCRVVKPHGVYNGGEKVGLTFAEYTREMKRKHRLFEPLPAEDQGEKKPAPPAPRKVSIPKLDELVAAGEEPEIAAGIVARQKALAAGKSNVEADEAAAEATTKALAEAKPAEKPTPAEPPAAPPAPEREADEGHNREKKPGRNRAK